ncbi:MAG: metallophosphoesterase [Bifidobacteriaceae bacterium]|jgi:predicted MPP superfamily phosphohydrolase|nr:metallophosphoesterase [Bifidobacteriaceae bacterium]
MFKKILLGVISALGFWAYLETKLFKIKYYKVGHNNIKLLHISDIHLWSTQKLKLKFITSLKSQNIDLIIVTGDNISSNKAIEKLIESFKKAKLNKVPGVFVFGSNDYFSPKPANPLQYLFHPSSQTNNYTNKTTLDTKRLRAGFEFLGWQFVENKTINLNIKKTNIQITGSSDYHLPQNRSNIFLIKNPANQKTIIIGLTHAPYKDALKPYLTNKTNYIFAGHTHGGQLRLPKIEALVTNSDLPRQYAAGVFKIKDSVISISEGLGTAAYFPFRFLCPPAVTILEI